MLVNRIVKKIWIILAVLVIVAAVCSSIFRSLTPWASQYKGEVERRFSLLVGQPVTIESMKTGWYWFHPVLKLEHITVNNGHKSLHVNKLLIGINLLKSILYKRIQPDMLYLDTLHLNAVERHGQWHIDGLSSITGEQNLTPEKIHYIISWLTQQHKIVLRHLSAHVHFDDGTLIPLSDFNLSSVNRAGLYKFKANAFLSQTNSSKFQLLGNVYFDLAKPQKTEGQIYLQMNNVLLAQWQNLVPKTPAQIDGGKATVGFWLDLKKGLISSAQAHVNLKRLSWHLRDKKERQLIQSFYANIDWNRVKSGWELSADQIKLRTGNSSWPENQIMLSFNKELNNYHAFIKKLLVESVLSMAIDWPKPVSDWLPMKPHGVLTDTQILYKDGQINYVATRFEEMGWDSLATFPEVDNLAGALSWQPKEGRLEFDSEHATLAVANYPTQKIDVLNGAIDWKELSDGLRVSIERFVISQPELTLSGQGVFDKVSKNSLGHVRFNADFSLKNLQQWMPYLPQKHLKPKLFYWLTHDVKKIAQASGSLVINGEANDFPFDSGNGEFSLNTHAIGGELFINSKWPIAKELEGYIKLNKRNLNIDLTHANFNDVIVKNMNLRINDIGKDKETLLTHVVVKGPAQKMMDYVLASPLKEKLKRLSMLSIGGPVALDLRTEIPLYPENDDNLARGEVRFDKNTLTVNHSAGVLPIDALSGHLSFDEKGITQSALTARAFEYPLNVTIQSMKVPNPYTTVLIDGQCTVDSLKSRFKHPALSLLNGVFSVQALFKITDNPNDMDNVKLSSNLKGLAIDLPAPLGKKYNLEMPLDMIVDFNMEHALRIRANYSNQLSTNLLFQNDKKGRLIFDSGQIHLGHGAVLHQNEKGLVISGAVDGVDVSQWSEVFAKLPKSEQPPQWLSKLRLVRVNVKKLTLLHQAFDSLVISGKALANNGWSVHIAQKKVAADLSYYPKQNRLDGFISYLHLAALGNEPVTSSLTPGQIPNLNLRIDDLSVGDIKIGNVTLKSHSSADKWTIDYCRVESPVYQCAISGDWTQKEGSNFSRLEAKIHSSNLAESLERWHISPVVHAGTGDMEIQGSWRGRLYDFSLANLDGSMVLKLNNGRITDLSKETEEKLGLGKLLSILSLQTIPRRLKLDFSDLSHQGYSFDVFKGSFDIKKGVMNTQDSYIDGPVAYASMKGTLDLKHQLYDLNLRISPHITASLPVVATIAGGPIAGLAAWVANKIISQSMQKIIAYSYKVSGPWSQPVVQQISIVRQITKK